MQLEMFWGVRLGMLAPSAAYLPVIHTTPRLAIVRFRRHKLSAKGAIMA